MHSVPAHIVAEVAWENINTMKKCGASKVWAGACYGKLAALSSTMPNDIELKGHANEAWYMVNDYFSRHGVYK